MVWLVLSITVEASVAAAVAVVAAGVVIEAVAVVTAVDVAVGEGEQHLVGCSYLDHSYPVASPCLVIEDVGT
ncbi:hypothetical protein WICPIJ_000756 [Wickerhamomyces pijperi]|uniref:Secreted protein n=1 Tax=Wickerhamomyces pijperi TaxID=599730 RepID=A0A9P8QFP2_WICPI|nr:hypothetical protein WICPIJ_000756 [Wickerhamomyces pijperi]